MDIRVIGKNSSNRIKLLKNIVKVQKDIDFDFSILEDDGTLKKYQNIQMPILTINDRIISSGKVLSDREIKQFIKIFV